MTKLTQKQFTAALNVVLSTVEKAQDRLQALAVDAAALVLAQGEYANDDKPRGDTSFGDMTRLIQLLEGVQGRAKAVNASALAMWMTEFLPVVARIDMKTGKVTVTWMSKRAKEMSLQDARDALAKCEATPFWSFREKTETGGKPFDLGKSVEQLLIKAMANGASLESITAALQVAAESEDVMKKVQAAKDKLVPSLPAAVAEAGAIIAAIDAE